MSFWSFQIDLMTILMSIILFNIKCLRLYDLHTPTIWTSFYFIQLTSHRNVTLRYPLVSFFYFAFFFLKFGLETEFITLAPVYGFEDTRPWMGDKINYFIWTTIMKRTAIKKNERINWMKREREKKMSMNWNDIPINKKTAVSIHKCKHIHARTHAMRCKIYSF